MQDFGYMNREVRLTVIEMAETIASSVGNNGSVIKKCRYQEWYKRHCDRESI